MTVTDDRDLDAERRGMADIMERAAILRETDADAAHDDRYANAAASFRRMAATMADVSDELLLEIGALAGFADLIGARDHLSLLLTAKLYAIGFDLPLYQNATAFLQALLIDEATRRRMN
jgi:hypothetical protein